ncbi:MAG TPA: hypothetical protein VKE22_21820 [Haliangiales bacterium]|nr:hypothetical protein [Haliangiales bacterium]
MTSLLRSKLVQAVEHALAGEWQPAHLIVQDHDGDRIANWIHAVVHRMEGDIGNAGYWYARCGRALREDITIQAELQEIRAALRAGASD